MIFHGRNRHILVKLFDKEEPDAGSLVILPDDFRGQQSEYAAATVTEDASYHEHWFKGDVVIFPRSMLQEFTFEGETIYLVQENYIICFGSRQLEG